MSSFLFYCLLLNHSFQTNPNSVTNCFKLILSLLQLYNYICSCFPAILIFEQLHSQHLQATNEELKDTNVKQCKSLQESISTLSTLQIENETMKTKILLLTKSMNTVPELQRQIEKHVAEKLQIQQECKKNINDLQDELASSIVTTRTIEEENLLNQDLQRSHAREQHLEMTLNETFDLTR